MDWNHQGAHSIPFTSQHLSVSVVCPVLKLIMVMPATNAISERYASELRRVKTSLRAKMSQLPYFLKYSLRTIFAFDHSLCS